MPHLVQIMIPASHGKLCVDAADAERRPVISGSACVSAWSLSPPGTNCSQKCDPCSERKSITAAAFSSDKLCRMLFATAGLFAGCHSTQSFPFRTLWVKGVSLMGIMICFVVFWCYTFAGREVLWLLILCRNEFLDFIFKEVLVLQLFEDDTFDAKNFCWSWRISHQCAADCWDVRPCCSAEQLQKKNIICHWISLVGPYKIHSPFAMES